MDTSPRLPRRPWTYRVWGEQLGLRHGYVVDTALPLCLGLSTLLGGWQRVSGNGWITMREFGGPYLWGTVLVVQAVVLIVVALTGGARVLKWTLWLSATVYGLAALWFYQSATSINTVSFWGMWLCLYAMANHITRANAYRAAA